MRAIWLAHYILLLLPPSCVQISSHNLNPHRSISVTTTQKKTPNYGLVCEWKTLLDVSSQQVRQLARQSPLPLTFKLQRRLRHSFLALPECNAQAKLQTQFSIGQFLNTVNSYKYFRKSFLHFLRVIIEET